MLSRVSSHLTLTLSLSKAMVVVEAAEKGGTKAAADSAIKHNVPLFVIDYQHNPVGNELLKKQNANLIRKVKNTGKANTEDLENVIFMDEQHPELSTQHSDIPATPRDIPTHNPPPPVILPRQIK